MNIYVDADASPVIPIVITIGEESNTPVILVKSYAHFSYEDERDDRIEMVYVDTEREAADYKIMRLANKSDVIITQDYGLASLGLAKGCYVIHQKGFMYTNENIDQLLHTRHESAKARRSGEKTKGPKAYTEKDREAFEKMLRKVVRTAARKEEYSNDMDDRH